MIGLIFASIIILFLFTSSMIEMTQYITSLIKYIKERNYRRILKTKLLLMGDSTCIEKLNMVKEFSLRYNIKPRFKFVMDILNENQTETIDELEDAFQILDDILDRDA